MSLDDEGMIFDAEERLDFEGLMRLRHLKMHASMALCHLTK